MALKRCPIFALSHCFWSWCVVSRRSNRVILFQILLVRWICTCTCFPMTNSLSTNIISGFFPCSCCFLNLSLILSGTIRSLHMAYFSIPTVLLSVRVLYWSVFSLDLFNMRWTICIWNFNFLMNVFSTLSVFSSACSWIPSNILSLPLIDLVWRPIWRSFNHFTSPLSVCTLSTISLFLFMIWLVCSLISVIFSLITLTSFFCYSVSIHKSHTLAISRTFAFMFWTSLFTVRIFHSRAWGLNGTH